MNSDDDGCSNGMEEVVVCPLKIEMLAVDDPIQELERKRESPVNIIGNEVDSKDLEMSY